MSASREAKMPESRMTLEDYLKRPYSRVIIPDEETGTFAAKIAEFPGCISQGDTAKEAYERLEEAAKNWIEAALDLGQQIPSPQIEQEYGGKFALRLPRSLHREASLAADREGTSLNQFIVYAVSEKVGALNLYQAVADRVIARLELHHIAFGESKSAVNEVLWEMKYAIQAQAGTQEQTQKSPSYSGVSPYTIKEVH